MALKIGILKPHPKADPEGTMTLVEHLAELRRRLIITILAVAAAGVIAFVFYNSILHFFEQPYCKLRPPGGCKLYVQSPLDPLSLRINISAYGGLVLALPVVLWQLWRFITPGLHQNEKRYSVPFILASLLFFSLGAFLAWLTFPHALRWLSSIGGPSLQPIYDPTRYLKLIVLLMVVFGAAFEFPVILVGAQLAGAVSSSTLRRWRRRAILIIFVFAAVATPSSDPFSMLALAVPMVAFYEGAIAVGKAFNK